MSFLLRRLAAGAVVAWVAVAAVPAFAARPPGQPAKGPGGTDYVVSDVVKQAVGHGSGQALIFRPAGTASAPQPVVVFLHAPGAISPKYYGAWIEHLVRKGLIVVYPRYEEEVGKTGFSQFVPEATKGLQAAFKALQADPEVKPDLGKVVALAHSGGAVIAVDIAAEAAKEGLPPFRLVFGVMPAKPASEKVRGVSLADLSTIDPKTVLVMVMGDKDTTAGESGARQIIRAASQLPIEQRLWLKLGSDNHGQPPLYYSHFSALAPKAGYDLADIKGANDPAPPEPAPAEPLTPKEKAARDKAAREKARALAPELWRTGYEERQMLPYFDSQASDATDYIAFWRSFDLARDVVLAGGDAIAIKRDPRLYDFGLWSDGWPLKRPSAESPKPAPPPSDTPASAAPAEPQSGKARAPGKGRS